MKLQTTKGATPVSTPTPDPIELDSKALDDPARYGRLPYRCTIIAIVHGLGREKLEGKDGTSVDSMCSAFGGRPSNEEAGRVRYIFRSEEHTSELQSLMRISYAVFCLKKKQTITIEH